MIVHLVTILLIIPFLKANDLPPDFVYLSDVDPSIIQEMRYYSYHNFVGQPIVGYNAPECILTLQAATNLSLVQQHLKKLAPPYTLKVYDCYRPVMSVDYFVSWSSNNSTTMQAEFYPTLTKSDLFPDGYIAYNSSHSRGSTMDLTIVPYPAPPNGFYSIGQPLYACTLPEGERFPDNSIDMGTGFDCFNPLANTNNTSVGATQMDNRELLLTVMAKQYFVNYPYEWWHFTLANEPFPNTYFNFTIEPKNASEKITANKMIFS